MLLLNECVLNIKSGNYIKCLAKDYLAEVDRFLPFASNGIMFEQENVGGK